MWTTPWKYKEGWVLCAGLFVTGVLLQGVAGPVDLSGFRYPVNVWAGGVYLGLLAAFYGAGGRWKKLRWFAGGQAALTSMASLLLLVVAMGLIRQGEEPSARSVDAWLGFHRMTTAWPFVLLFLYFLSVLGWVTIRRLLRFRWEDMGFYLNHAGLFLTLWAALLGSGDLTRLRMTAPLDTPEWRAADASGGWQELPLAIELKAFRIESYPPKLMLIDNLTGEALPQEQPVDWVAEEVPGSGKLLDWDIRVTRLLPLAACVMTEDTANFVTFPSEGAVPALYVEARNRSDGGVREGWVSCGNYMFPYVTLRLDEAVSLVMPDPEPRRFTSEVVVYTPDKKRRQAMVEVNKPLTVAGWKIYQLSYDEQMGRWSRTSVFELVRDPWLPVVYAGILLMIAGALWLFITAPQPPGGTLLKKHT